MDPFFHDISPTERRNRRSKNLDKLPLRKAIALMLSEEASVPKKLHQHLSALEKGIHEVIRAFQRGGRLFYVGAGTSGRLGVLDAVECPPTFSTAPEMIQGILAGGKRALWSSVEGAEDDARAGAAEIRRRRVAARDVVVGIAASGTTPFVWGALAEAKKRRASTILICFNPFVEIPARLRPTLMIAPNLGPEVLTGSTRLKAGTATKLILNLFTTLAMVQLGKVRSNLMIEVNPANTKLRARAIRIVRELSEVDERTARKVLIKNRWVVKAALKEVMRGLEGASHQSRVLVTSVSPGGIDQNR